jgi:hypothetical protein
MCYSLHFHTSHAQAGVIFFTPFFDMILAIFSIGSPFISNARRLQGIFDHESSQDLPR